MIIRNRSINQLYVISLVLIIIIRLHRMEFTEIHQISSFSVPTFHSSYFRALSPLNSKSQLIENIQQKQNKKQMMEAIKYLDQINSQLCLKSTQLPKSTQILDKITQNDIIFDKQTLQEDQYSLYNKKYDRTKSIIFSSSLSNRKSLASSQPGMNVRVYFFGTPLMKSINYNQKSTIKQLIKRSLDAYLLQNNHSLQALQPIQKFQMRLPSSDNQFLPDLCIEPIHNERILSDNMFQSLVLVEKTYKQNSSIETKNVSLETKPTKQYSVEQSSIQDSSFYHIENGKDKIIIKLMNQKYFELMRLELQRQGTLEPLFKQIKEKDLNQGKEFVIKEDPQSEFDLSQDYEVRLIQKNRLYLMTKRYLDQAQDQLPGPIRLKTLIHQELNYLPPIGMTQASRYEEFSVTKVNSLGIAIDRILGIDQTKIYNYQKQFKINQRQTNLIDKFLGLNPQTGTKIPCRFIKEIVKIQKFTGGIEVVFPQKTTTFIIKNEIDLQKIHRKLSFLLDLNKNPPKTSSLSDFKIPKRIASLLQF